MIFFIGYGGCDGHRATHPDYSDLFRWDDKSALESNAPVLAALKQEQQAQMHGRTAGRIQSANNSRAALPNDVLNWLATDDDVFSSSNGSERGMNRIEPLS